MLLCPLNIPKTTIVYAVGCSLNLNISHYCSFVSWEYGQRRCHLTLKVVRLIRWGEGSRAKKPGFLERKAYGKENTDSISKASMHACGVGIYIIYNYIRFLSFFFLDLTKPGYDI